MKFFYKNNKKPDICLVFCGWGTDERLYLPVLNDFDYLLCFDYDKELLFNPQINFDDYYSKYLLTYSAGGFIPTVISDLLPNFKMKVSVNSSTHLFDRYGLSQKLIEITRNLNTENYLQFRRNYMVDSDREFELFNLNQPKRSLKSCLDEMDTLKYLAKNAIQKDFTFDRMYSSKNDKVLPYKYQKELYGEKLIKISGGHFPFYRYKSLKEFFK